MRLPLDGRKSGKSNTQFGEYSRVEQSPMGRNLRDLNYAGGICTPLDTCVYICRPT